MAESGREHGLATEAIARDLALLAEYRGLTVRQLAFLRNQHERTAGIRMKRMKDDGLVDSQPHRHGQRGRPTEIFHLTGHGTTMGRKSGMSSPAEGIDSPIRQINHHALVVLFRLHVLATVQAMPVLSTRWWAPHVRIPRTDSILSRMGDCIPDSVLLLGHEEVERPLLLFLEAETGTNSLTVVRKKIDGYAAIFRSGAYEAWADAWDVSVRGFRVLFVTTQGDHVPKIAGTAADAEAGFVWVSAADALLQSSFAGAIWSTSDATGPRSVLGSRMPESVTWHDEAQMRRICG